jgi:hypothetical protein
VHSDISIDQYLRLIRVKIDVLKTTLDKALEDVPENLRNEVRTLYQQEVTQPIRRIRVISGTGGPRSWFQEWNSSQGYHWLRLRQYLLDHKGRSQPVIDSIDDATDKILSHIEDPRSTGPDHFLVRGLVLGHVQGGKTANFTALITKAADVGYKLVIVLSGIHNALRKQTQRRLSLELGLTPDPDGVGLPKAGEQWLTLTKDGYDGDFRPGTTGQGVLQGTQRTILVIKKNASVLRRLIEWIDGRAAPDLPVLIVDDEADQASINTGGNRPPLEVNDIADLEADDLGGVAREDEIDPSTINKLIRDLISSFNRVSYVAYTATPFANILIDPEAFDRKVYQDLYPKDFIISLPRGNGYVGAERLFGRQALDHEQDSHDGLDVIELIPEHERDFLVPPPREGSDFQPQVTPALELAIVDFLLATAAKVQRLGDGIASMLIHTSHFISVQRGLGEVVRQHVKDLRRAWRYSPETVIDIFRDRWNVSFRPIISSFNASNDLPFESIHDTLNRLFKEPDEFQILVLNTGSQDVLDYEENPKLKVIIIGGNRLSRGLTLEDLLISFYVRDVNTYDTLLQMARWFGYRENYVDLTKIWTTADLVAKFRHLALVEEELRDEIAIYERSKLTPAAFGPKIRTHPAMRVTARNKLGSGSIQQQSYASQLVQTTRFWLSDYAWLISNLRSTIQFCEHLGTTAFDDSGRPEWSGAHWNLITDFLRSYKTVQDADSFDAEAIRRYIERQASQHGEVVRWRISIRSLPEKDSELGVIDLHIKEAPPVNAISRSRLSFDLNSIGALASPARAKGKMWQGDEEVGLSAEQIARAREQYISDESPTLGHALRAERDKAEGLMLIYPISPFSRKAGKNRINLFDDPHTAPFVIGLAFSFPSSESGATVEYVVGAAGAQRWTDDERD